MLYELTVDYDYQKTWDEYVKAKDVLQVVDENSIIYHVCKYPSPLSDRDYLYNVKTKEYDGEYFVYARDVPQTSRFQMPEKKGLVRAGRGQFWGMSYIKATGPRSSAFVYVCQDDPAGNIPKWVINVAAKKGVPAWMKKYKKAADKLIADRGF